MTRRAFLWVLVALGAAACMPLPPSPAAPAASAAIAMPDAFSATVAAELLQGGGNAVDAAVAAAFALAVTYPEAGNLGGGGFMLALVSGQPYFLDYREVAPGRASRDMYLDARGEVIEDLSLVGPLAAGVPGTVAGLWAAHQRFGVKPWRELLAPAVALARDGFIVPAALAAAAADAATGFAGRTNFAAHFGSLRAGETFRQPALAATLERIASLGPDDFYRGETARLLVAGMERADGLISADDLAAYQPVWREPVRARWRQYEVLSAPPPSSGGFAVVQLLQMKAQLDDDFAGLAHDSARYVHLVAEMQKRVFADRAEYLGDPDFVDVPLERLLDPRYVAARAAAVDRTAISSVASVPPGLEPRHTTHFSIVDRWGNAVANTYTLNTEFGSGVVVEGAGFLLNNEMDDFSIKPGASNYYGVVGSAANAVEPGKRMLSSMAPTIVLEDGSVKLVVGSPGGSTIISSVFETIVNVLDFGMAPDAAVAAARFHHQLLPPDLVTYDPGTPLPAATIAALTKLGYRVEPHPWTMGDVQLIVRGSGGLQAASDPRGRGVSRVLN